MTTWPWDPMAGAAARGGLRASDADREQVIDTLKAAFVQGRLTKNELDVRTGHALASRTCAELAAITADIPAALTEGWPPAKAARVHVRRRVDRKVGALGAYAIILLPALGTAFFTYYGGFFVVLLFAFIGLMVSAGPSAPRRPGPPSMGGRR